MKIITRKQWEEALEVERLLRQEGGLGAWDPSPLDPPDQPREPNGPIWLLNALSLNMISHQEGAFYWRLITPETARVLLARGFRSAVGHEDLARVLEGVLGVPVPVNRATVVLEPGDRAVVAQYKGPRLPEGATRLPGGSSVGLYFMEVF
ncbi:DUF1874 domain-containing protein [Thermus sp. SYSU G05001]|uniref:DUF1874 domain-containing protein n=1 Tax=Thermus brevis TaxID=2862456 RepID=A0ABS7A481_9DEIN|nr:DUF1874 domain-containing protein [Thermus brevis]MBW6395989.1 DUF1874 domain-containing protein [Thermus brevis]